MMIFDREALSDKFDSISLAKEIRRQFGLKDEPAPLHDIARAVGIYEIREAPLKSVEGALIMDSKFEGAILLNENQMHQRKRFTLAHELGHFVHPQHFPTSEGQFNCSKKDIFEVNYSGRVDPVEEEANEFASEIIIPHEYVEGLGLLGSKLNFEFIIKFSEKFDVSKSALIRKLHPLCTTQTCFIFSKDGIIRYLHAKSFPSLKVWSKDKLPKDCLTSRPYKNNTISSQTELDWTIWLCRDPNAQLTEQAMIQENGFRITMLTLN